MLGMISVFRIVLSAAIALVILAALVSLVIRSIKNEFEADDDHE